MKYSLLRPGRTSVRPSSPSQSTALQRSQTCSASARSPRKSCDLSCHTLTLALETYQLCLDNLALNSTLPYLTLYEPVLIKNLTDLSIAVKPRTGMRVQSDPIRFSPLNSPSNYFGRRFGRQKNSNKHLLNKKQPRLKRLNLKGILPTPNSLKVSLNLED